MVMPIKVPLRDVFTRRRHRRRNVGTVAMRVVREGAGTDGWRIAMCMRFPGPRPQQPLDAERLVSPSTTPTSAAPSCCRLDVPVAGLRGRRSGARRSRRSHGPRTGRQYPDRLIAFCSLNPVSDAAWTCCASARRRGRFEGIKIHFSNNDIDLADGRRSRGRARVISRQRRRAGHRRAHHNNDGYGRARQRRDRRVAARCART